MSKFDMRTEAALTVSVKGLNDGKYPIELTAEAKDIEYIFPEFFGTLRVTGTLRKHGRRYIFDLTAFAPAHFICDVSGEEYDDTVTADFSLEYIANTQLALLQADTGDAEPPLYIRDDDTKINITEEVRQEIAVRLPAKRVAPEYRNKDFGDIFPSRSVEADGMNAPKTDDRWAALQNISFET